MAEPWRGIMPAMTTQFHEDQSLDLDGTEHHLRAVLDYVHGFVMCGSLGESQTMDRQEKLSVVERAIEVSGGRVPVITGVAEMSTRAAIEYVKQAEERGVSGLMIMPPMVYRPDRRETMHFFRTVAAATRLPWMLYNNPVGYHTDVTPEMFAELSDLENLVAIKESSGDPRRITEIRNTVGDRYALFTGVDDLMLECAVLGLDGGVSGAGIAFPEENHRLWQLTQEGRWDEARTLYRWSQPLMKLDSHVHFVQYIKLLLQEVGLGKEWVREPRLPLAGQERERVLEIIRTALSKRPSGEMAGKQ
jgi:4-hydroxy-tetrahydrodipicolinate synthase